MSEELHDHDQGLQADLTAMASMATLGRRHLLRWAAAGAATGTAAAGRNGFALNVTATEATAPGYVTVWPDGTRPTASSLNCTTTGQTISNHVVIADSSAGGVNLYTQSGTHLAVYINGWYV